MFPSANKYYALLSLCCCKMLPLVIKPKTAARPSAGLLAAAIYELEETTEAPSRCRCLLCLTQKPAGSCQAQLEKEGRGKVLPCSPGGIFLRKCWVGNRAGSPSAGLGMAQSWCKWHVLSCITWVCTRQGVMP